MDISASSSGAARAYGVIVLACDVRLNGRWQVGRLTKISTGMGAVTIDLTEAEFDDGDVQIVVDTGMGSITVIAPQGLDVRQVRRSAAVKSTLEEPIPGFPVVRLSASCGRGISA